MARSKKKIYRYDDVYLFYYNLQSVDFDELKLKNYYLEYTDVKKKKRERLDEVELYIRSIIDRAYEIDTSLLYEAIDNPNYKENNRDPKYSAPPIMGERSSITPLVLEYNLRVLEKANERKIIAQSKIMSQILSGIKKMNDLSSLKIKEENERKKKLRLQKIEVRKIERKRQQDIIKKEQSEYNLYLKIKSEIDLKYNQGLEFINSSNFPEAVYSFSEALKLDNYNKSEYDLFLNRGIAKISAGDMIGCISDMDKSINLKGNSTIKLFNKGLAQFNLKKFNEALNSFNELLELDASYKEALFYRGLSKINLEKKEEGCLDLSKAGELGFFKAYDEIKKHCS
jgi:tetratricopeptide (TPR) repeat protein